MENFVEKQKSISEQIINIINETNFGQNIDVIPVDNIEIFKQIKDKLGTDIRSRTDEDEKYGSIFNGLDFDLNKMRSQSFAIYDKNNEEKTPVGIMTFIIAPKWWAEQERYIEKVPEGVIFRDYSDLLEKTGNSRQLPDYTIMPAWTKVDSKYLGKFALPGFRVMEKVINLLSMEAPENTFIQMVAQGTADKDLLKKLKDLISVINIGQKISKEEMLATSGLDFSDLVGRNTQGSESTVKTAKHFQLDEVINYGSASSLGPVFIKKIK
ncbi:MAG: hypothetical protein WAV11_03145 [Minisyncoccia bacterium]